ncbi:MAG: DUF3732 domain-containing protein [Gallionella sp.]
MKYIGVLDKAGKIHAVKFFRGLNVITGKSSTGKSAIIEIFDYCFGSSDQTVPEGVITEQTDVYFTVLEFKSTRLVLARKSEPKQCFLKELPISDEMEGCEFICADFFSKEYFSPLENFKKELGRYFGVILDNVDESAAPEAYLKRKSSTPSARSFTSFMLQHQNLVANKHAVFYRFDEQKKREQAIDHFKVFMGLADQEYFLLARRQSEIQQELKRLNFAIPKKNQEKQQLSERIDSCLKEYSAISGTVLIDSKGIDIVKNPQKALSLITNVAVRVDALSNEFNNLRQELEQKRSSMAAELRLKERKRSAFSSSVRFAEEFQQSVNSINTPQTAEIAVSTCPFCRSETRHIEHEVNKLTGAIHWLNAELRQSSYMRESFIADEQRLTKEIDEDKQKIKVVQNHLEELDKQIDALGRNRSMPELAMKEKLRLETMLELLISRTENDLELKKEVLAKEGKELSSKLGVYDMDKKLDAINRQIEDAMREISQHFDFEESYRPINLKFALDSFDLWHEREGKKIFLRAMGSGANWLYCHLTLFLALHRVFSVNSKNGCKIPPILFLDQPTQVYFPNYRNDVDAKFDPKLLGRKDKVDDDLLAVNKMYNEIIRFCDETERISGLRPQVIVTDHADHLELGGLVQFDSFVRARWRDRGFILQQ